MQERDLDSFIYDIKKGISTKKLCQKYGGKSLYVPKKRLLTKEYLEGGKGLPLWVIKHRYDLSPRSIRRLKRKKR